MTSAGVNGNAIFTHDCKEYKAYSKTPAHEGIHGLFIIPGFYGQFDKYFRSKTNSVNFSTKKKLQNVHQFNQELDS